MRPASCPASREEDPEAAVLEPVVARRRWRPAAGPRLTGYLAAIFAFLLWGTGGVFVRAVHLSAPTIMFSVAAIGVVLLLPAFFARGCHRELGDGRILLRLAVIALLSSGTAILYYNAIQFTTIANALLSHYLAPVLVTVLAPFLLPERRHLIFVIALMVGLAGLGLVVPLDDFSLSNNHLLGVLFGFASAVLYALALVLTKRFRLTFSAFSLVMTAFVASAITAAPFAFWVQGDAHLIMRYLPLLIVMAAVASSIPWLLYAVSIRFIEAQRIAILGFFEPASGIALASLFVGEVLGARTVVGAVLVVAAGLLILLHRERVRS